MCRECHTFIANKIKFYFLGFIFVEMGLDQGLYDIFMAFWELEVIPCIQPWFKLSQSFMSFAIDTKL